jgi:hypothetical protein
MGMGVHEGAVAVPRDYVDHACILTPDNQVLLAVPKHVRHLHDGRVVADSEQSGIVEVTIPIIHENADAGCVIGNGHVVDATAGEVADGHRFDGVAGPGAGVVSVDGTERNGGGDAVFKLLER